MSKLNENDINSILASLSSLYTMGFESGKFTKFDDDTFDTLLSLVLSSFGRTLSNEEIKEIKKRTDSRFQITIVDGIALLDDYDHESNWYTKISSSIVPVYWGRYKAYLANKGWSPNVLNTLGNKTLNDLMNYLGDPNSKELFSRKGIVMGDVQSGKTSNYIGLLCKAADAGYKVFILLTGITEELRKQTQIRVEEGFIGWDDDNRERVGVGKISQGQIAIPKTGTLRSHDFTGTSGDGTLLQIIGTKEPFIFITKKNSNTLQKIRESISKINIDPNVSRTIDSSLLIIDDEADNASVNTNKENYDPTTINTEIRKLLDLFNRSTYIGFTATPFANVFIDPESQHDMLKGDLFPKDFIYSLNPPSNYVGANKYFNENKYNSIQIIDDHNDLFPLKHKKDIELNELFDSLIEAINAFLIINVIRDKREGERKNSHRSMMINITRFIRVNDRVKELVDEYLKNATNSIYQSRYLPFNQHMKNKYIFNIHMCYEKHYKQFMSWDELIKDLFDSIKNIKTFKVPPKNKKNNEEKLDYESNRNDGLRAIVIGGLALSRGLTLEGLTISYLYRNTATFDVLMQMGRWFGYRDNPYNYEDLCKIWMLEQTQTYFKDITDSINELKEDFQKMVDSKMSPKDFGIRVRNESDSLGITDRNKMRNVKKYVYTEDLFGSVLETPFIHTNIHKNIHNYEVLNDLLNKVSFDRDKTNLIAKNVDKSLILGFLDRYELHPANVINYFQQREIIKFINDYSFEMFDIAVISGRGEEISLSKHTLKLVERSFDTLDKDTIRINGVHRKLGGTSDTTSGLTKEQLDKLSGEKPTNKAYMIQDRNPILLIYPLKLKKVSGKELEADLLNGLVDKFNKEKVVPVGIGIGFPRSDKYEYRNEKVYMINERTNWLNSMYEKDNEDDE